jgi:hypothetical protein
VNLVLVNCEITSKIVFFPLTLFPNYTWLHQLLTTMKSLVIICPQTSPILLHRFYKIVKQKNAWHLDATFEICMSYLQLYSIFLPCHRMEILYQLKMYVSRSHKCCLRIFIIFSGLIAFITIGNYCVYVQLFWGHVDFVYLIGDFL